MDKKMKSEQFPLLSTPENVLKKIIKSMELLDLSKFSMISKKTKSLANMKSFQFTLLSNPRHFFNEILKRMDMYDLVNFSQISGKTKLLVSSLISKPMAIDINVADKMYVYAGKTIYVCHISKINDPVELAESEKPGYKPIFDGYGFFDNLLFVTKQTTIRRLVFRENVDENFLPIVFYVVPYCESIVIMPNVSDSAQRKILAQYQKTTKQLILYSIPPVELRKAIMAQNSDCLRLHHLTLRWMKLDDLLMANSAALGGNMIGSKVLNKFFKLWIRNKCNPRLEYLWTDRLELVTDLKTVLAGIDYKKVPADTIRIFKLSKKVIGVDNEWLTMADTVEVRGGYDLKRKDGTIATVAVRPVNVIRKLEFFIWNCV